MAAIPREILSDVDAVASSVGVDSNLALATVIQESGGNPNAVGDQGCSFGLLQLNACAGEGVGYSQQQLLDPVTNLQIGLSALAATPYPGDPGAWAAAAQRPADPAGYAASVDNIYAQLVSGGGADVATDQQTGGPAPADVVSFANQVLGSTEWGTGDATFCETFVEQMAAGKTGVFPSALDAASYFSQNGLLLTDTSQIQEGDVLYFTPPPSAGHTGIYCGDGTFTSVTNSGVQNYGVMDWLNATGQQLVGFVPLEWFQQSVGVGPYVGGSNAGFVGVSGFGAGPTSNGSLGPSGNTTAQIGPFTVDQNTPFVGGFLQGKTAVESAVIAAAQEAALVAGQTAGGAVGNTFKGFFEGIGAAIGLGGLPVWVWVAGGGFLAYKVFDNLVLE